MKALLSRLFTTTDSLDKILAEADAALAQGNKLRALSEFDKLLAGSPRNGVFLSRKSAALLSLDRLDESLACAEMATAVAPGLPEAWHEKSRVLFKRGEITKARIACEKCLELMPAHAKGNSLMGTIQLRMDNIPEAEKHFAKAVSLEPRNSDFLFNQANALRASGRLSEAEEKYCSALEYSPDDPEIHTNLGNVLMLMGHVEDALQSYDSALEINGCCLPALTSKALLYEQTNKLELAREVLVRALEVDPSNAANQLTMAILERRTGMLDGALNRLRNLDPSGLPTLSLRSEYHFELARVLDRLDQASEAFSEFVKANSMHDDAWRSRNIDRNGFHRLLDKSLKAFSEEWLGAWCDLPIPEPREGFISPVFIIGFPRSGTTLLDQIIGGHPKVQVLEELSVIPQLAGAINEQTAEYPEALLGLDEVAVQSLRQKYFELTARVIQQPLSKKLVVDKLPLNIVHLGLIHRIFPDAHIVMALRHPCDVVLSCFMQKFHMNDAMANFSTIEETAVLYDKVMSLYDRYRQSLPLNIHYVRYERLLNDLEGETRHLASFLGIEWNEEMLNYRKTALSKGHINTPSYAAVSEGIYHHATGRWKRYAEHMSAARDLLNPWINVFDYEDLL